MAMAQYPHDEMDAHPCKTDAYHVLHLLPSAPRELIVGVYQRLARQLEAAVLADPSLRPRLDELNEVYAGVMDSMDGADFADRAGSPDVADDDAPDALRERRNGREAQSWSQRSPWGLLHLDPDAPPDVVDLAYRFWRNRVDTATQAPRPIANASGDAPDHPAETLACLIPESGAKQGMSVALGQQPLRVGTDPTCNIVVAAQDKERSRKEARIWLHKDRFILHGLGGTTPGVHLNGAPVVWAVLEDGDKLQIGNERFRFKSLSNGASTSRAENAGT